MDIETEEYYGGLYPDCPIIEEQEDNDDYYDEERDREKQMGILWLVIKKIKKLRNLKIYYTIQKQANIQIQKKDTVYVDILLIFILIILLYVHIVEEKFIRQKNVNLKKN